MKAELRSILKKYPFIHIDTRGKLSIIVPLTGARTVSTNFTTDSQNPISLYLFGDNSCRSDIERTAFFAPRERTSFEVLFSRLIDELTQLINSEALQENKEIIKTIISSLNEQKTEALKFQRDNPVSAKMQDDLCQSNQGFVVKGEFIVTTSEDNARTLNLPNVLNLIKDTDREEILSRTHVNELLVSINAIPSPKPIDLGEQILQLIHHESIRTCQELLNKTPNKLFELFYTRLKICFPTLPQQRTEFYQTLVENLQALYGADEDYSTYTADDIKEALKLIFDRTELFKETQNKSFSTIFHHALIEFGQNNGENRINTYKLFIVQTFLYLCALQLRIKNTEQAKQFLSTLQDPEASKALIEQLCTKEADFMRMLQKQYGVSSEEYNALIESTHQIAVDHIEAPHFDELRVACMAVNLTNTHYLILGSRLCWSTNEITESSNINSEKQQKHKIDVHYELFYKKTRKHVENRALIASLQEYLRQSAEYESIALQSLEYNSENFSRSQNRMLLELAISQKKYLCAAFLVSKGVHNEHLFTLAFNQKPLNEELIRQFVIAAPEYTGFLNEEGLANAIEERHLGLIKLILTQNPNLLEARMAKGCTPLLLACQKDNPELVDYLLSLGADTLAITSGETVQKYAIRQNRNEAVSELFNNYHLRVRELLRSNHNVPFLSGPEYLLRAIEHEQHQLIDVLLEFFPTWIDAITGQDLINAVSARSLPAVQTILRLKPGVLNEPDQNQQTAFFHACKINSHAMINHLMNAGADIFQQDNQGQSPREALKKFSSRAKALALFMPYYQRLEPSSEHYADIFNSNKLRTAILEKDHELVDCILEKHPEFISEITGADLFKAIADSNFDGVKYILKHRIDLLEYKNPSNKTPFFYACEKKYADIATYLAEAGANIHAPEIISRESRATTSYSGHALLRAKDQNLTPSLKELLRNYNEFLKSNSFQNKHRITEHHIIDAIDARDLTCVDHLLILRPELKTKLGKNDLLHIEQQRAQDKLNTQYMSLLVELQTKRDKFPCSYQSNSPYQIMTILLNQLKDAGAEFFNTHISKNSIQKFNTKCNTAIENATPVLSTHRGWHGFPLFVRAILGVIAGALIIPALIVSTTTPKGYLGTFFKSPETDSTERLKQLSSAVDTIRTELSNTIQVN